MFASRVRALAFRPLDAMAAAPAVVSAGKGGVTLINVRVTPNAKDSSVDLTDESGLCVRTGAAPADGAANADVLKQLSKTLGVGKSTLELVRGQKDRDKTVAVTGMSVEAVKAKLEAVRRS